jgi:hypothetical protein
MINKALDAAAQVASAYLGGKGGGKDSGGGNGSGSEGGSGGEGGSGSGGEGGSEGGSGSGDGSGGSGSGGGEETEEGTESHLNGAEDKNENSCTMTESEAEAVLNAVFNPALEAIANGETTNQYISRTMGDNAEMIDQGKNDIADRIVGMSGIDNLGLYVEELIT